jgi:phosphopantothenate synthetase
LDENKRESEGVNNMFLVIDDLIRYMKGINEIIDMYSKKDIKSLEGIVKKYRDTKIIERSDKRLLKHILYKGIGDIKLIIPNLDYYVDNCL